MKDLMCLRTELDRLDGEIMSLLNARFALMDHVAVAKKAAGIHTTDPNREADILEKTQRYPHAEGIAQIYRTVFEVSKSLQRKHSS